VAVGKRERQKEIDKGKERGRGRKEEMAMMNLDCLHEQRSLRLGKKL
jgi:hypothetical protein